MAETNKHTLEQSKAVLRGIIDDYFVSYLIEVCHKAVDHAVGHKEYGDFTGNTVTSYACGLYVRGELEYVYVSGSDMREPLRIKVKKGELAFLEETYDKRKDISVKGEIDTDWMFGEDTSVQFLQNYKSKYIQGYEIVMTTGTEYSTWIEKHMGLNVLTETYQDVPSLLLSSLKPI